MRVHSNGGGTMESDLVLLSEITFTPETSTERKKNCAHKFVLYYLWKLQQCYPNSNPKSKQIQWMTIQLFLFLSTHFILK